MHRTAPQRVGLKDLLSHQHLSCIDGRKHHCTLGVPGGNMGVFIVLLTAIEHLAHETTPDTFTTNLNTSTIQAYLADYVRHFGSFYMHSDELAMRHVCSRMNWNFCSDSKILGAPVQEHQALLELLTQPEGTGCGHIKLMLQNPEDYHARQALIQDALAAFFMLLWQRDPETSGHLIYHVLIGEHEEEELLIYDHEEDAHLEDETLELCADCNVDGKAFAYHKTALRYIIQHSIQHAVEWFGIPSTLTPIFTEIAFHNAKTHLVTTQQKLLPELPVRVITPADQEVA